MSKTCSPTVLVVDDEVDQLESIRRALVLYGYAPVTLGDPRAALALIQARGAGACDLLFTDLTMPRLSGLELCTRVRALMPALPILAATGHCCTAELGGVRAMGIAVLAKPFSPDQLDAAIRGALASDQGVMP